MPAHKQAVVCKGSVVLPSFHASGCKLKFSTKSSGVEVDVISHKRQRYAVWFGGSLMASLVRPHLRSYK